MRASIVLALISLAIPAFAAPSSPLETASVEHTAPADDACDTVCGVDHISNAQSQREALCSETGLESTLACALCIDTTWSETTWEDSALAEYERIVEACKKGEAPLDDARESDL
ncbi:hypothetical protein DB88DRAFT_170752 [Papiliotrema laurentii]|uniref:Uncharacterized protein n=1 Tax=Papiliotrema laurentii TaxID=5418 RepID=A0AAD9L8P9_PAPLA|nr:hypothetical protein DB88DRAFT_170752 [Papiliotrema laurentii]